MERFVVDGLRAARRLVIAVFGSTILVVGLALLFLPGPAFVVIPIGLGILALEFKWARRWLRRVRDLYAPATTVDGEAPARGSESLESTGVDPDRPSRSS